MKNFLNTKLVKWIFTLSVILFFTDHSNAGDVNPFLGKWALTLPNGPGWLDIRQENGYLDADILWLWGSVVPVDFIYLDDGKLLITRNHPVVRVKESDGKPGRTQTITTTLEISVNKDKISGKIYNPSGSGEGVRVDEFTGVRIPPMPSPPDLSKIKYAEPVRLFNGKDLSGWRLVNENSRNGFKVVGGELVNDPVHQEGEHSFFGNLRTDREFDDFNLKIDVNIPEGSNSGIYLKGIYEIQVFDSYNKPPDPHNMGAVYSRITPSRSAEKPAGQWQTLDITLCNRHVTVILNGQMIIDNQPVYGVTGGALTSNEFIPGPIYLQGDHGTVKFRNIVLTPIKN